MDKSAAIDAFQALSNPTRLDVFRLLIQAGRTGMSAGEIAQAFGVVQNTMSAHLGLLLRAGLVRNSREGRVIRYFAEVDGVRGLLGFLMEDCCGGAQASCQPVIDEIATTCKGNRMKNVLFLCTGNSARSIMAEAVLNREGLGKFKGFSAGSHPAGQISPMAADLLARLNYDVSQFRSKSWDEFAEPDAPKMDFIFTVCDKAAGEQCPFWPGQPMTAHWGLPDPVAATGTEAEKRLAFSDTYRMLRHRIQAFANLPMASLDKLSLKTQLDQIGTDQGRAPDA